MKYDGLFCVDQEWRKNFKSNFRNKNICLALDILLEVLDFKTK